MQRHTPPEGDPQSRRAPTQFAGMTSAHLRWVIPGVGILAALALFIITPISSQATRSPPPAVTGTPNGAAAQRILPLALPRQDAAQPDAPDDAGAADAAQWHTVKVRRGDTLSEIFSRDGLSAGVVHAVLRAGGTAEKLKRLYPGDILKLDRDSHGNLLQLVYEIDKTHTLKIVKDGDGFKARAVEQPLEKRIAHATGTVDSSLFLAGKQAGLPDKLIMQLADIFGWDIDFALDIRAGDTFTVLYEKDYLNGEKVDDGDIIAAEFVNQGKAYRAVRFETSAGHANYYTADGKNVRKAFLRTPVKFTRITSRFNMHRYHPILHRIRPHRGVDYAAPTGTPVRATGDGRVIWKGRKGGYGNVIILQHGRKYRTVYAHLSGYARTTHVNGYVKQGQIIGYVGSTGLATGPHLHYEFHVNGVYRNPLTVKLPQAAPIAAKYRSAFRRATRPILAQLNVIEKTSVALNNNGE